MAELKVTIPKDSQNIEGVVTIRAPLECLGMPERGHVLLERANFSRRDAETTEILTLSTAQSCADRDGMLDSGMESGWRESVAALGRLLEV